MADFSKQVKEIIDEGTAQLSALKDEGRKVADRVRAKVDDAKSKGIQAVAEAASDLSQRDLLDRFGTLRFSEIAEKLRSSEFAKHGDVIRQEVLASLEVPTNAALDELSLAIKKLSRDVTSVKKIRDEVKKLAADVKALKADVKELKKAQKTRTTTRTTAKK